ncbi:GD21324 [Drosophila simulans]|uniref:GD21324 n=1 Tax=Drosophila simulans TaxID=7240 RepID=B4QXE0_DROSI|nr:GD21324 [Drosophila simulans]
MIIKVAKFLSIVAVLLSAVEGARYLAEKPDFLVPCIVGDPNFNVCLTKNFQSFFRQWKDGIPGYNAVGSFDPLYIKRVKFTQDASRSIAINADLKEVYVAGAGQALVMESSWDPNHYVAKTLISVPKLRFNFDYKVKGHVVALNLNGHGKGYFEAENALIFWRDFYEVLRPAVEQTVGGVLLDRFKKTFVYVPATYLIKDFH